MSGAESEMPENTMINVDEIMAQIRAEIKEKGLDPSMLSFDDVPFDKETSAADVDYTPALLQQSADYLGARSQLEPYKQLTGNPIAVFFKKIIRKLVKFYIMPLVTEQNAVNYHTANAVRQLNSYVKGGSGMDDIASRLEMLELKQAEDKKEIDALRRKVAALSDENSALKNRA